MAKTGGMAGLIGGSTVAFAIGALFFSWFINMFFLYPIEGVSYSLTIITVFQNLLTLPVLQFLFVAVLVWLGYFGAILVRSHHSSSRHSMRM